MIDDSVAMARLRSVLLKCGRCITAKAIVEELVANKVDAELRSPPPPMQYGARGGTAYVSANYITDQQIDDATRRHFAFVNAWEEKDVGRYVFGIYRRMLIRAKRNLSMGTPPYGIDAAWLYELMLQI